MDIEEKLEKLHEHVIRHPNDYQAVIAEVKLHSDFIEHQRYLQKIDRLQHIAEIRKQRDEKRRQRNRDGRGHAESDSPTRSDGDALSDTI